MGLEVPTLALVLALDSFSGLVWRWPVRRVLLLNRSQLIRGRDGIGANERNGINKSRD